MKYKQCIEGICLIALILDSRPDSGSLFHGYGRRKSNEVQRILMIRLRLSSKSQTSLPQINLFSL